MYQRDSTYVISAKGIRALLDGKNFSTASAVYHIITHSFVSPTGLYNESTLPYLDWSDRANASIPYPVIKVIQQRVVAAIAGSMDKSVLLYHPS